MPAPSSSNSLRSGEITMTNRLVHRLAIAVLLLRAAPVCLADDGPKADPAGISTGDKSSVVDAAGNSFTVAAPTDPKAPDYAKSRKDYEDYQSQAAREPLAVKLADSVGHLRIATNFAWTLNTGYLVLFMQCGFALLTCWPIPSVTCASPPISPGPSTPATWCSSCSAALRCSPAGSFAKRTPPT